MTPIFKICPKNSFLVSGQKKNFFTSAQEFFKSSQIVCLRPYRAPQGIKVLGKYHLKVKICTRRPQSKLDCENLVSGKNACIFKFSKEGPISWLIKTLCIFKPFLYDPTHPSGSEYIPLETPVCIRYSWKIPIKWKYRPLPQMLHQQFLFSQPELMFSLYCFTFLLGLVP